ncbi:MAG: methyltransferase type 12 [Pseudomonadota bacterium]
MQPARTKIAPTRAEADSSSSRKNIDFLRGFLRNPGRVGSVIPSSRFMERKIIKMAEVQQAGLVVELGPGTGGTTRAMLAAMSQNARLLAIDLDPRFIDILSGFDDPRLLPHHGSAVDLAEILQQHGIDAPNTVVSGIPFSTMPKPVGTAIIQAIQQNLAPNGVFLAYQFRGEVARLARPVLGEPDQSSFEMLNIPPMRFYQWRK